MDEDSLLLDSDVESEVSSIHTDYECDSDISYTEDAIEYESEEEFEFRYNEDVKNNIDQEFYEGPSGIVWASEVPTSTMHSHNTVVSNSGIQGDATNAANYVDFFKSFITDEMLDLIVTETNQYITNENKAVTHVTKNEILAFFGILLAAGKNHNRKQHISELWKSNKLFQQHFYTAVMSRNRFTTIYSKLRFDNRETRSERINTSGCRDEAIKFIFDKFTKQCIKNYSPGEDLTVDERLATYRGRCPFKVFMKSKPGRYGIKLWMASDSKSGYICNGQIYTGKRDNKRETNQGCRVVLDMVRPYFESGRGVTTDNFFTSVDLAKTLMKNNLALTGTLRANKRDIPKEFLKSKNRELYSSKFGFAEDMGLVSYVPRQNYSVNILTSKIYNKNININNDKKKPEIILHYNATKGGVDLGDKMTREYSCMRATRWWPFRMFMEILDMAVLNSYILFINKFPEWHSNDRSRRRLFIEELSVKLAAGNVADRLETVHYLHKPQKYAMYLFSEICPESAPEKENVRPEAKSGRCNFCKRDKDRKARQKCMSCNSFICPLHKVVTKKIYCPDCKSN